MRPGKNLLVVKVCRDYLEESGNVNKVVGLAVSEEVTQNLLKDLPHGFYGNDPAGIWQPVTPVITNPLKIEDVFFDPGLYGGNFQLTVKKHSMQGQDFSIQADIIPVGQGKTLYNRTSIKTAYLNPGEQKVFDYRIDGYGAGGNMPDAVIQPGEDIFNFNFEALREVLNLNLFVGRCLEIP